jgi:hypothetical protein
MDMVRHAANLQSSHFVFACDATQIRPETLLKVGRDEWATFFSAKNDMHEATDKRVHAHTFSLVPAGIAVPGNLVATWTKGAPAILGESCIRGQLKQTRMYSLKRWSIANDGVREPK